MGSRLLLKQLPFSICEGLLPLTNTTGNGNVTIDSTTERALRSALGWLSPRDLLAVSGASKGLRSAAVQPHLWDKTLEELEAKLPLQPKEMFVPEDYPPEFMDPRHSPEYETLTSFQQANYLGQYHPPHGA